MVSEADKLSSIAEIDRQVDGFSTVPIPWEVIAGSCRAQCDDGKQHGESACCVVPHGGPPSVGVQGRVPCAALTESGYVHHGFHRVTAAHSSAAAMTMSHAGSLISV